MKLTRRTQQDADPDEVDVPAADATVDATVAGGKNRPTPKRRVAEGRRGPVSAPKTRKEAAARQRQLAKETRTKPGAVKPRSAAEQRAAYKAGDPTAMPRRDQGRTRKLARDYVDSHRMLSNYLLWLFPLFIFSSILGPGIGRLIELIVVVALFALIVEWYVTGRRLLRMAKERYGEAQGGPLALGWYMGSRAYLPRRWRLPAPQVERGAEI